ncbi:MAG: anti-sigma factor [Saprospiraceae bacterium]|nr:anti-sigma factor [Saprospiraceae bacterium]
MNKENFLASGLLEQYALGITSNEENAVVENYLKQFPEIRTEFSAMRNALDQYAQQYAKQPPQVLRQRVIEAIENEADRKNDTNDPIIGNASGIQSQPSGWPRYLVYAATVFLAISLYLNKQKSDQLQDKLTDTQTLLVTCETDNEGLRSNQDIFAFVTSGHTQQVAIKGNSLAPGTNLMAYWNEEESRAMLNTIFLPEPPADKQYQIWADVEGEMISLGLLDQEEDNNPLADLAFINNAESLNITLEPLGGSEKPTVSLLVANGNIF